MIRRSAPWSAHVQPKKGCFHIPSQIKKNFKNPCRLEIQSKFYKIKNSIKFSWKDAILAPLHASADHHVRRHQDKLMASIWHPDKFRKILKKLSKIYYEI